MGKKRKKKARKLVLQSMKRFAKEVQDKPIIRPYEVHPSSGGHSPLAKKMAKESVVWASETNARNNATNQRRIKRYQETGEIRSQKK